MYHEPASRPLWTIHFWVRWMILQSRTSFASQDRGRFDNLYLARFRITMKKVMGKGYCLLPLPAGHRIIRSFCWLFCRISYLYHSWICIQSVLLFDKWVRRFSAYQVFRAYWTFDCLGFLWIFYPFPTSFELKEKKCGEYIRCAWNFCFWN